MAAPSPRASPSGEPVARDQTPPWWWWPLCLFVAALALRVHWNLVAHPIGEFLYSDMNGYNSRADQILDRPFGRGEYRAFFPFGTQLLLAPVKLVFGKENFAAIGIYQALLGSLTVVITHDIARRVTSHPLVAPAVGLFMVIYYPLISLGGYILSETPATLALALTAWLAVRLEQGGELRHAWWIGVAFGLGALIRPQLLFSAALVFAYWLAMRRHYPRITWGHFARAAVPVVLVLGFASGRMYWHTGRVGTVSENGAVNLVFGRCHNKGIYSMPDDAGHRRIRFSPPPLLQLESYSHTYPERLMQLEPVFRDHPGPIDGVPGFEVDGLGCRHRACLIPGAELEFVGYMGDRATLGKIARACVKRGGMRRQLWFSFTHVVQLWAVNDMWPDQANPRPRAVDERWGWNRLTRGWRYVHNSLVMVPALLGLAFVATPRRRPGLALLALNLWGLLIIAAVYLGGIRFRVPYDPLLIILAAEVWAIVLTAGVGAWRTRGRSNAA